MNLLCGPLSTSGLLLQTQKHLYTCVHACVQKTRFGNVCASVYLQNHGTKHRCGRIDEGTGSMHYYICMCTSICVYIYAYSILLSVHASMYTCMHGWMDVCKSVCLSVCLPVCLPACLSVCLSVCLSLSVCMYVCGCEHVCM